MKHQRLLLLTYLAAVACAKDPTYGAGDGAAGTGGGGVNTCTDAAAGSAADGGGLVADAGLHCNASCDFATGVPVGCATRFQYGVNYAWNQFGGDFGGIDGWGVAGVSQSAAHVRCMLADMRAHGVDTVRWWVWPDFRGDGVSFDAAGTPTGLGGTVLADIETALRLSAETGVHVQFCLFSFDNFRPDRMTDSGRFIRGTRAIVLDGTKRGALMERAIRPFVRAVNASPHRDRAVSWDVINEPEWAITGSDAYGDEPFTPQNTLEQVTHPQMETFVRDVIAAIRAESPLPVTVGSAAAKWPKAWSGVDVDFYSIHIYDWVNMYWPYSRSPAQLGLTGKPVVMGEFPVGGLTGVPYAQMVESWYTNGYAGALGWAVSQGGTNTALHWAPAKTHVKAFADTKGCSTSY